MDVLGILIMAGQLLLALSILVGVHEAGHMFAAKYFGMRVEKFSIGFPPKIFGFKKGETEYSFGAVPLGGFVKISGMIDESLDTKELSEEPKPYEFRAKPAWQRLIVMMGGIIVNVVVGIIIFIALTYIYGAQYIPASEVNVNGIVAHELGKEIGLKTGDKIVNVNGKPYERFPEDVMNADLFLTDNNYYIVDRNGEKVRIDIPSNIAGKLSEEKNNFISPIAQFKVAEIDKGTNAAKAGLKPNDLIIAINGDSIRFFHELTAKLATLKNKNAEVDVLRDGKKLTLKSKVDEEGKLGFRPELLFKTKTDYFTLLQSVPKGTSEAFAVITNTVRGFGKIFKGDVPVSKSVSGPIGIASKFGSQWIWQKFWFMTGLLSMVLAFMNFLPIPALDGGHVMFLTYEIVSGRKPSDKFLEVAQKVGMVILLSLMVFAFGNDIFKIFQ
jgi:regulator of sigma E protease